MGDPVVYFEVFGRDGAAQDRFYRELFGWSTEPVEAADDAYRLVDTGSGEGIRGGLGSFEGVPPYVTVYVRVDDLDGRLAQAQALGGRTLMEPREVRPGLRVALFADPAGNMVGLMDSSP